MVRFSVTPNPERRNEERRTLMASRQRALQIGSSVARRAVAVRKYPIGRRASTLANQARASVSAAAIDRRLSAVERQYSEAIRSGSATEVAAAQTALVERLAIERIVALPDNLGGASGTDVELLRSIGASIVHLDKPGFEYAVREAVENLADRMRLDDVELDDRRLTGWCWALNQVAGMLYCANRHFLYETGDTPSDYSLSTDVLTLALDAVDRLDQRYDRWVESPFDWAEIAAAPDNVARKRLANCLNYLARDRYAFANAQPMGAAVERLGVGHFDILVHYGSYPVPAYSTTEEPFLRHVLQNLNALAEFFSNTDDYSRPSYLKLMNRPGQANRPVAIMWDTFLRCARTHNRHDLIESTLNALRYEVDSPQRNSLSVWQSVIPGNSDQVVLTAVDSASTPPPVPANNATPSIETMSLAARLEGVRRALKVGALTEAKRLLPLDAEIQQLNLGQLHSFFELAPHTQDVFAFNRSLHHAAALLGARAATSLHDVNLVARLIQFNEVATENTALVNAITGFDYLVRRTGEGRSAVDPPSGSSAGNEIILLLIEQCRVSPALLSSILPPLLAEGIEVQSLQQHRFLPSAVRPWQGSPLLTADCTALVDGAILPGEFYGTWEISLSEKSVVCDGVNYYQGIYEKIARTLKVFDVDWDVPAVRGWFDVLLRRIDRTVAALDGVRAVAERDGLQVRIPSLQSHFAPASAVRAYCEAHPENLNHVTVSSSYENWKTNVSGVSLSTIVAKNDTKEYAPSIPAFGTAADFETWRSEHFEPERDRYYELSRSLTGMARSGDLTPDSEYWCSHIRERRAEGRKVFCLLGKIPYDLAVPYQGGPAHTDMKDWLNHTIDTVGTSESVLYVKPHPHEVNQQIAARPIQGFLDLIEHPDTDGVFVLPFRGVNLQDLLPIVDVFLCWNGSSIAEIGSLGCSIVAADDWASLNYPIDVSLPKDRNDFEMMLRGDRDVAMGPGFEESSTAYTCYVAEAPFAIRVPFFYRSSTNTKFNNARIELAALTGDEIRGVVGRVPWVLRAFDLVGADA